MWICFFEVLGWLCYQVFNDIVVFYEINCLCQVNDGVFVECMCNIFNGIDLLCLFKLCVLCSEKILLVFCLLGCVVLIKDVKIFICVMCIVVNQYLEVEVWIVGLEDEDLVYVGECYVIVDGLGLMDKVKFFGFQKIDELMFKIGLVVFFSISEVLLLVLLEGFVVGVLVVVIDVGLCCQLLYGLLEEDQVLGVVGEVVGIVQFQVLVDVVLKLLIDLQCWYVVQVVGIVCVECYYIQDMMFGVYCELYQCLLVQGGQDIDVVFGQLLCCLVWY